LSKNSMSTELIHAQQWARRPRKRVGSVACSEYGGRSETIASRLPVRTSRGWLKCYLEDETQWGVNSDPASHDGLGDASAFARALWSGSRIRHGRRAVNDTVNGVQSQPNRDDSSHSVNMGSPKLAAQVNRRLYGDGVPILPKSQPVMGVTVGNQSDSALRYKSASNGDESLSQQRESGTVFVLSQTHEGRIASAFR
jgi:hypothetical protein